MPYKRKSRREPELRRLELTKLELERRKLKLEIRELGGWRRLLSAVTKLLIAILALAGAYQYVTIQSAMLELEKKRLAADQARLREEFKTAENQVRNIVNEPSGMAGLGRDALSHGRLMLAVDDDENNFYVLRDSESMGLGFSGALLFEGAANDLESVAVCENGDGSYAIFGVGSHRRFDDAEVSAIYRTDVTIGQLAARGAGVVANGRTKKIEIKHSLARALKGDLSIEWSGENGEFENIRVGKTKWLGGKGNNRPKDDPNPLHPWALEIEGAACFDRQLWLSLKYPLALDGSAILLRFDLNESHDLDPNANPQVVRVRLPDVASGSGGASGRDPVGMERGVSSLEYDPETGLMLLAITPSMKPRPDVDAEKAIAFGNSVLAFYKPTAEGGLRACGHQRLTLDEGQGKGKLEGLAFVGDDLWLSFDGDSAEFSRIKRTDLKWDAGCLSYPAQLQPLIKRLLN